MPTYLGWHNRLSYYEVYKDKALLRLLNAKTSVSFPEQNMATRVKINGPFNLDIKSKLPRIENYNYRCNVM